MTTSEPSNANPEPAAMLALLREAIEELGESFVVCDAEDRIVYVNQRFREMNAAVEPYARPGMPYADFVRAGVAQRLFPYAYGREADFIAETLGRRSGDAPWTIEFPRADGQWRRLSFARLPGGGSITYSTDVTEFKRGAEDLRRQTERLLIGQRTAGMIIMDWEIEKDILTWSDSPERLLGPLPASGKYPLYKDQVHPLDRANFLAMRQHGIERGERYDHEYRLVRTDGKVLWIRSERVVIKDAGGKSVRMLVALHDVTERKKSADALARMNEELERRVAERTAELESAYRELESFSYSVSHDLRAPLRAIGGFANLLRAGEAERLSAEGRRQLSVIENNALRMGALIDAMLKLARTSRHAMAFESVDMHALAQSVCEELRAEYPRTRIEVGPMPPANGDRVLLRQVYANLIGNALKFSARVAAPEVSVGATLLASGVPQYYVRDNGTGFDMAHAQTLFAPFQRLHAESEYAGTGIGLALTAHIVQRHHGRIEAEAAPGQGARFWFTIGDAGPPL